VVPASSWRRRVYSASRGSSSRSRSASATHWGMLAGEDEAGQARGLGEGVLHGEHTAPRLAQEVDVVEPQLLAHRDQLVQEELDAPQRRVVWLVGVATPKLVVEDDRAPGVGESLEGFEVVVRYSGTAMEHQ
jgi:hypothetical protein